MLKSSITDYIFENKVEKKLFNEDDQELEKYEKKMSKANDKMFCFINQRVHPRSRKRLKQLIEENDSLMCLYFNRQGQIYYNSGFTDGINLILSILFS